MKKLPILLTGLFAAAAHVSAGLWSDPATWGGSVPATGQNIIIPSGVEVILDVNTPSLGNLEINGTLRFDRRNVNLTARNVIVHMGLLEVGTEASPFAQKAQIILTGTNTDESISVHGTATGTKGLIVHGDGTLELHGARRSARPWTKLNATASAGATQITVADTTGWRVGDQICIGSSGFDPFEAEKRTITAISGNLLTLNSALTYKHWGTIITVEGKQIDERAAVGLLTRDIVVRGADDSDSIQFGGHTIIHQACTAHIEGVEFYKMGQMRKRGRYPIHWHFTGDGTGQYAKNNSVHNSFHRGIVTHAIDNARVEGNVCYDIWSHVYVLSEDGVEVGNVFNNNLGMLCKRLNSQDFVFGTRNDGVGPKQSEWRPGVFWLKKANNTITNNYAAGASFGIGYFYDLGEFTSYAGLNVIFDGNVASSIDGNTSNTGGPSTYPPATNGHGMFASPYIPTDGKVSIFKNFTAFKCRVSGTWMEDVAQIATNHTLADNGSGFMIFRARAENSFVVGQTANTVGGAIRTFTPDGRPGGGVHIMFGEGRRKAPKIRNVKFVDTFGAAIEWREDYADLGGYVEKCTFIRSTPIRFNTTYFGGSYLLDDGSIAGNGKINRIFAAGSPLIVPGKSVQVPAWNNGYYHPMKIVSETIVDNPSAVLTGTWTASSSTAGFYGTNYVHDGNTGKGTKSAKFGQSALPAEDWYTVYIRYPASTSYANNVPVDVNYSGSFYSGSGDNQGYQYGTVSYVVNQQTNGGVWNKLTTQLFEAASDARGSVVVKNTGTTASVIADAVKFSRIAPE